MTTFLNPVGRKLQVPKEDLYMFTALWMQESPWTVKSTGDLNVVGSVFVLPNDRVLSADCTRQHPDHDIPVHGAIRPLIKFPDKVKGCQVYLTRKPCAHCAKMLVQARVSKVFYLPLQPEKPNEKDEFENKSVDALFQVSEVSKSFYVPNISEQYIDELINQTAPYGKNTTNSADTLIDDFIKKKQKWNVDWYSLRQLKDLSEENPSEEDPSKVKQLLSKLEQVLDWQEYGDEKIAEQVQKDMDKAFKWFYLSTFATGEKDEMAWDPIGKTWGEPYDQKEVTHLSRLAQMLSNRTDDPYTGVGCVITSEKEIVSIGWNGFPSKALFGNLPRNNFPRKKPENEKKYLHVIHAEQNALLSRNQRNLKDSVVYVNMIPCDDCMSMLYELGVRRLVLPVAIEKRKPPKCFYGLLNDTEPKIAVLRHKKSEE